MLFNSLHFVIFLPVVIILYYLLESKWRWLLLLLANYVFYMAWNAEYALLILTITIVNYFVGREMGKEVDKRNKRLFVFISLFTNLGLLALFRYFNFFSEALEKAGQILSWNIDLPYMDLLIPVGISFYTLQSLSYIFDIYQGKQKPENHFGYFALYVSFFPQLVAGPIARYDQLAPQFRSTNKLNYDSIVRGLRLILFGLFCKLVIADNLNVFVEQIYSEPQSFHSFSVLSGIFFYSLQIYADFYGYSLIAIGSALLMNIHLVDNFNTPYLSKSIAEFWRRWHISLSSWFRDYVYFPLGGNKRSIFRWSINILVVFLISSLWHGANWNFMLWGALFGLAYLLEKSMDKFTRHLKIFQTDFGTFLKILKTFLIVSFAWVFFRSPDIPFAFEILKNALSNFGTDFIILEVSAKWWILLLIFIVSDVLLLNTRIDIALNRLPLSIRWMIYTFLIISIVVFSSTEYIPFIYYQF